MTENESAQSANTDALRSGMIAVVGRANVGKSTLMNALFGEKVSIVSPVAQTTRNLVRGILNRDEGQLVFLDTPGIHKAKSDLGKFMNKRSRMAVEGVDVILLVLDQSTSPRDEDSGWMRRLLKSDVQSLILLNKTDAKEDRSEAYRALWKKNHEELTAREDITLPGNSVDIPWMSVSAKTSEGLEELMHTLFTLAPIGPALFPDDVLTDYPRNLTISDVVREKLCLSLHDELPHAIAVEVVQIDEEEKGWKAHVIIYVNRPSQKPIVIGHKGRMLRKIKRAAEKELMNMYEHPVRLEVRIKIEPHWNRNFWFLKKLGYVE